jgi:hypothetical protein
VEEEEEEALRATCPGLPRQNGPLRCSPELGAAGRGRGSAGAAPAVVAAMLRPRGAEGTAVALLRLLLLLLLLGPKLRGPGLGVVGAAGAGLPESVIWAVNAGGEAHVDVHGIHFRKDPLEGRVGRGESPSGRAWGGPQPGSRAQLRASNPFLSSRETTALERSFSLQ